MPLKTALLAAVQIETKIQQHNNNKIKPSLANICSITMLLISFLSSNLRKGFVKYLSVSHYLTKLTKLFLLLLLLLGFMRIVMEQ